MTSVADTVGVMAAGQWVGRQAAGGFDAIVAPARESHICKLAGRQCVATFRVKPKPRHV